MSIESPKGRPISCRPIASGELERVVLRCWPDRASLERLFENQGTIGMAAWEGERCVAQLHCYRVVLPGEMNQDWPEWNRPWWRAGAPEAMASVHGPLWCHACLHVGRTLESSREETRALVYRFSQRSDWDSRRVLAELDRLDGVSLDIDTVREIIQELRSSGQTVFRTIETEYHGRGIGTALCEASSRWAREHGYAAVLATGAPKDMFEYAKWAGQLPCTSYAAMGFRVVAAEASGSGLPSWAGGNSPPEVMSEVESALAGGRPVEEIRSLLMVLDLERPPGAGPGSEIS